MHALVSSFGPVLAQATTEAPEPHFAYWDIFVERLGPVLAGAGIVVAVWVVWTLVAMLIFRRFTLGDESAKSRWLLVLSGLVAVASALYFGLVLRVG
jgi:uncharacterized membrane protein YdbT with pleckstrin-like domain